MSQLDCVRKEFKFLWTSPATRKVIVAARGTGKTVATLQFVLDKLLTGAPNSRAVFFSSTLKQVKQTVEPIMRQLTINFDQKFCSYNKSEYIYKFKLAKDDQRELILLSYENPEAKRGLHPQLIVLDECASMPASMFGNIISPMLVNKHDILIAIGTAQGKNKFYELFMMGISDDFPDWESYRIRASDCALFDSNYLFAQKNTLTSAEYAQEYECDFNANVLVGSVYGEFIDRFTVHNIDDCYGWNPDQPVYTAWDLGYSDYTAIWFFQKKHDIVTFIDYYEDSGKEISFYADYLITKPYIYKKLFLPHDGSHSNIRGASVEQQLTGFGFKCEVLPCRSEFEGIDAARTMLKTCRFDAKKCAFGLDRLKSFKYKIDRKTGLKLPTTEHSDASHCADAFRYAAMSKEIWNSDCSSGTIVYRGDYSVYV